MSDTLKEKDSDIATAEKEELKEPSKYNVVVHNNDNTSIQEVVLILSQVFEMSEGDAVGIANTVHSKGRGICGTYISREIADMKLMLVEAVKNQLIQLIPHRVQAIRELKFTVEKS